MAWNIIIWQLVHMTLICCTYTLQGGNDTCRFSHQDNEVQRIGLYMRWVLLCHTCAYMGPSERGSIPEGKATTVD